MIRFKIYKNPSGVWLHQQIGANGFLYKPFILGKFAVKFDGDYMKLNEEGGSRRFYDDPTNTGMRYDEVQVFVNGVGETFGSVQALAAGLRDLFYPGFDYVISGEGLQTVTTENSDSVLFFGTGWPDNPLRAEVVGGGGAVFPTGFVTVNPILRTGDTFTFQAGETYNLDNNPETLLADFVTTIATEDEGISRIDVIYALPGGTYGKSVGTPGEIAQKPDIPDGALERTQFNISGDVAEDTVVIVPQVGNIQNVLLEGSYTDQTYNHIGSGYSINSPNGTMRSRNFMIANGSLPGGFIFGGGGENSSGASSAGIMRVGSGFRDLGMRLNGQLFYNAFTKTTFAGREIPDAQAVLAMIAAGGTPVNQDNIFKTHTFALADLGVATFAEVTEAMMLVAAQNAGIDVSQIELYMFEIVEGEPLTNFDVTADWENNGVTDQQSFQSFMVGQNESSVLCSNFSLENGRLMAYLENVVMIDLFQYGVTDIRKINISGLEYLNVSGNQLTSLVDVVFSDGLEYLTVSGNQLTSLVDVVFPNGLEYLNVNNNQLTSIVDVVFPNGLVTLYVSDNQLTSLVDVVFPNGLVTLGVSQNQITSLVDVIFPDGLQTLYVNLNQLTSLVDVVFSDGLEYLTVSGNQLTSLVDVVFSDGLQTLFVNDNQLTSSTINSYLSDRIAEGVTGRTYNFTGTGNQPADPSLVAQLTALGNEVYTN